MTILTWVVLGVVFLFFWFMVKVSFVQALVGLAIVGGIAGARLFYVIHYAGTPKQLALRHILDLRQGGLEFYGGIVAALILLIGYLLGRSPASWVSGTMITVTLPRAGAHAATIAAGGATMMEFTIEQLRGE